MKKFYNIQALSDSEVDILIYGVIGSSFFSSEEDVTAFQFIKDFKNLETKYSRINIRINSPGGYISEGNAIFNVIQQSKVDTHSYIDGIAFSMAAIIALAAKTVHSAKNGLFLLHNGWGMGIGNAKDMRTIADDLDKYDSSLMQSVIDKTGLTEQQVKNKWFNYDDHLMTAQEAFDEGLIDDIIAKEVDIPKDIKDMNLIQVMNLYKNKDGDNQEKFLKKIANRVREMINPINKSDNTNLINNEDMKDIKRFTDLLALDANANANEDAIFAAVKDLALDFARVSKYNNTLEKEKGKIEKELTAVGAKLDAIHEDVKKAETPEAKADAVSAYVTSLENADATAETIAQKKKDEIEKNKKAEFENYGHNKVVEEYFGN